MGSTRQGRVFVISGPSGGGKTTVVQALLEREPTLARSVSVTTRPRRPSERDGADYRFVSAEAFARLRRGGQLLEWAKVHEAFYGTPKRPVERMLARGRDVILSIDVQGAWQVKRRFGKQAVLIFLKPPSLRALAARLRKRRTETPQAIRRRLEVARQELACVKWYDDAVVNRRVQDAVSRLRAIVKRPGIPTRRPYAASPDR